MRSPLVFLKLALLFPAYALFATLAALAKRPRLALALAATSVLVAGWQLSSCTPGVRIGTFNIERFGARDRGTDMPKLTKLVASLDADILAVQEIQDEAKLRELAATLSRGSRAYEVALSKCGGRSEMRVGFLYDERRVSLASTREYPELAPGGGGSCSAGDRPGFLGVFNDGTRTLHLLVIHLTPRGERSAYASRKVQWARAHTIAARLRAEGATAVAILGDANSTGYLDDENGERTFVDTSARNAGMSVVTGDLSCSEYWKQSDGVYAPSLLDHAVVTQGLVKSGSARVHGYCEALRCARQHSPTPPDEFTTVSDHCPVTFDTAR